ncbi:Pr6Pr family membrane protein [Salinibacterium sp. NSLL150]|uniref:Pr6Pr family membrane protein n=1 Tax=unclassified Salinibacterium TaxID=2632331 RepID=UPI0018CE241B|nr:MULTISPECIES: Pr6Pr family membrane protein [unclassified Salinibacterium]MBH0098959.1 Pr6Pr family membrane protein [Salinibacterium sp. NSLL35]MBH0101714.1 Pr6Pr family membrane protein [Salinibacterium sp. NSLL150]MBH0104473.1 Pr6Pr family membrane protein [Salinibacterium sp. NSLL16]MBH0107234.1 Pr6Pr family membrane protein [Salinibacterium sp. NSLL17]
MTYATKLATPETRNGTVIVAVLRLAIAALVTAAVIATVAEAAGRTVINPFNMFGYFTIQSNIILAVVYAVIAVVALRGEVASPALNIARASVTTYIIIVGVVYATLLAPLGAAGGVPVAWANAALHIITPIYALADWILFSDRGRIAFNRLWIVLIYPIVWVVVVLVRGATDGWVPYPFLHPDTGYGSVFFYVGLIVVVMLAFGSLVFWISGKRSLLRVP